MLYQQKSFSLSTTTKPMTDEQYQIAMGLRCPDCHLMADDCGCVQARNE